MDVNACPDRVSAFTEIGGRPFPSTDLVVRIDTCLEARSFQVGSLALYRTYGTRA